MILLLIKASVIIAFLILFYKLFLEKESFFAANRIYLLACLLLACMLPFVALPEIVDHQGILTSWVVMDDDAINSNTIEKTVVEREDSEQSGVAPIVKKQYDRQDTKSKINSKVSIVPTQSKSISYYLVAIYLFGVFVFLFLFLGQIFSLMKNIYQTKDKVVDTNYTIVNLRSKTEPCSFFRFVFISPESYDYQTYERILKHELTHVRLWHSLDLILAELAIIILWFNPFVWLLRKDVEKNIEYQTDQILINDKNLDKQSYQMSLLGLGTKMKPLSLTTNYNQSLIKQRILKMNSKKSNPFSYCKYVFVLPLIFTLLLIVNQPLDGLANDLSIETTNATNYRGDSKVANTETITMPNEVISESSNNTEKQTSLNLSKSNCAALTQAIRNKNVAKVKELLAKIDPNCIDPDPPIEITKIDSDLTVRRRHAGVPLIAAARIGHIEIAKLLVEAGADVDVEDRQELPILAAANDGHTDFIAFLIEQNADKNSYTQGLGNALHCAARNGHLETVSYLMQLGVNKDKNGNSHGTPLNCAARNGHNSVVLALIEAGTDINLESNGQGSALNAAARNNHIEVMKTLLENGARIDAQTNGQGTALNAAARNGHRDIVEFLIQKGAQIDLRSNGQGTALSAAKRNGHNSIVRLLESKGAGIKNFELYQNEPNPFRTETVIGFDLPKAASATLTVYNVEGKIVKTVNGDYEKGYNEIKLYKSDLVNKSNVPGILYYQLDCENFSLTKKMILIEKN